MMQQGLLAISSDSFKLWVIWFLMAGTRRAFMPISRPDWIIKLQFSFVTILYLIYQIESTTLNSVYNDYVYNDTPVIAIEFHGPGHDVSI